MTVVLDGEVFAPLEKPWRRDDALVLHRHQKQPRHTVALFVHGLGGRRYGTWKNLPRFLFEDFPDMDIGLYDYVSGMRRGRLRGSESIESTVNHLADTLRDIDQYEREYQQIILIAHSMGGLITQAALLRILDGESTARNSVVPKLAGLFLLAVPRAGSLLVPPITPGFRDAKLLRTHGKQNTSIQQRFTNRVLIGSDSAAPGDGRLLLPTFGMRATRDRFVDDLSSTMGLPESRFKTVRGTHSSIIKPRDRDHEGYRWLRLRILDCQNRLRAVNEAGPRVGTVSPPGIGGGPGRPPLLSPRSTDWRASAEVPQDTRFGIDESSADLVAELSARQAHRIVSIRGRGGAGKTTLAYDVTDRLALRGDFDRIAWVSAKFQHLDSLGQLTKRDTSVEWDLLLMEIARQLSLTVDRNNVAERLPGLLRELGPQERCLIVMDNLETVGDNALAVKYLERVGAPHKILITTRHSAREISPDSIQERVWNGISEAAARQLVRHLARDAPELSATLSQAEVDSVVLRSECVPLIIRLVISLVIQDSKTVDQVVTDLNRRTRGAEAQLAHYLFDASLDVLRDKVGEDDAVRLLNVFCAFAPGGAVSVDEFRDRSRIEDEMRFEEAKSVACRLSLVQALDANRRFTVHSLLREFICDC